MPTYEYQCEKCGVFETQQKMSEEVLKVCPSCGSAVQRLLSAAPFHLKGSGWYKTDYASSSSGSNSTQGEQKEKKVDAPAEKKTESKKVETSSKESSSST